MTDNSKLIGILDNFEIDDRVLSVTPLGSGLINDTYLVRTSGRNYALQRINNAIFKDVELLQHNIEAVTGHIRERLASRGEVDIDRKVLNFIRTRGASPKTFVRCGDGTYWRVSVFIEGSHTYDIVNPEYSSVAGHAFGEFESMLVDLDEPLGESIPDFHNMPLRLAQIREAVSADPVGRASGVSRLLDLVEENGERMCLAEDLHDQGILPKRICHCDSKVGNILFDDNGKVLCVIDLDTVMPSFVFSDFGDFMRTAGNPVPEDSPEFDKVEFRMDIFEAFAKGYVNATKGFLLPVEKENLPYAVQLFAFMQSVRFLCDYINGDTYYKTAYPEHNLVRAENQMKLFLSAKAKEDKMRMIIDSVR